VLLRAGRITAGTALAAERRRAGRAAGRDGQERDLARGPARVCQALGIDRALDGAGGCGGGSPLQVTGATLAGPGVSAGPRVGVSHGAEEPWRFWITGDPTVSVYRPHVPRRRARA